VSSSTGSAVSEDATLGLIDGFVPLSEFQLVAWRDQRTSETGYVPKDVTSSPADIILAETHSAVVHPAVSDADMSDVDPDGENLVPPPPHTSQLSIVPPNERANLTHMGFTLLPYARYFHLRWLRTISFRVLLPAFSLALAFCPPRHSTVTDRITLCWHRRCQLQQHQRQSRPPSLPHDMPIIWARCHRQI
jgi:hypothetical protein